jgi:hypothetical protein
MLSDAKISISEFVTLRVYKECRLFELDSVRGSGKLKNSYERRYTVNR